MSKRFTDTDKYKKSFIRSLQAPYKILWDYICLDCNHAGIWHKDFEVAQVFIGKDAPVNESDALSFFNNGEERITVLKNGSKWFIRPFVDFQYGRLNPENRVHYSVIEALLKEGIKPLTSPLQGAMDKDKDKDKDKNKDADFLRFWDVYPKKREKEECYKLFLKIKPDQEMLKAMIESVDLWKKTDDWIKENGQYIPYPKRWLKGRRWEDQIVVKKKDRSFNPPLQGFPSA